MSKYSSRSWRVAIAIVVLWCACAAVAWWVVTPGLTLVGAKGANPRAPDYAALLAPELNQVSEVLSLTNMWGMQRDGQAIVPKVAVTTVEIEIVWDVIATVIRPKERYLLVRDQGTKLITPVHEGEKLPDGSKLLRVGLESYLVRTADGKKRTVETGL